jgi:hypothetical protein
MAVYFTLLGLFSCITVLASNRFTLTCIRCWYLNVIRQPYSCGRSPPSIDAYCVGDSFLPLQLTLMHNNQPKVLVGTEV